MTGHWVSLAAHGSQMLGKLRHILCVVSMVMGLCRHHRWKMLHPHIRIIWGGIRWRTASWPMANNRLKFHLDMLVLMHRSIRTGWSLHAVPREIGGIPYSHISSWEVVIFFVFHVRVVDWTGACAVYMAGLGVRLRRGCGLFGFAQTGRSGWRAVPWGGYRGAWSTPVGVEWWWFWFFWPSFSLVATALPLLVLLTRFGPSVFEPDLQPKKFTYLSDTNHRDAKTNARKSNFFRRQPSYHTWLQKW